MNRLPAPPPGAQAPVVAIVAAENTGIKSFFRKAEFHESLIVGFVVHCGMRLAELVFPSGLDCMRITGGKAARRILKVPKGLEVRPTPDLVKQAVFNSLGERVLGAQVLELFAGTGALSLECLSRGAASTICVEKSARHAEVLRRNFEAAGFSPELLQVRVQDVFSALGQLASNSTQFDLILADPPYGEKNVARRSNSFAQQLLDHPTLPSLLRPNGVFVLGHAKRDTLSLPLTWHESKMLRHGDSVMRFLKSTPAVT